MQGEGSLGCAQWTSSLFWPVLCPDGHHVVRIVTNVWILWPTLRSACTSERMALRGKVKFPLLAL